MLARNLLALLCGAGLALVFGTPGEAASFDWRWANKAGETLHVEIFSKSRNHVWPGNGKVWVVHPDHQTYLNRITCNRGEKICYGAWSAERPEVTWGVGKSGDEGCQDCCYTCDGGASWVINFGPAPAPQPTEDDAVEEEELHEDWVAEGGAAKVIIGSLSLSIEGDFAQIVFENGRKMNLERVAGVANLWKVNPPHDPILKRGTRLCGNDVTYMGIFIVGELERFLKPFVDGQQPRSAGDPTSLGGGCGTFPLYEKKAHGRL